MKRTLSIIVGSILLLIGVFFGYGALVSHGTNLLIAVVVGAFTLGTGWELLSRARRRQ